LDCIVAVAQNIYSLSISSRSTSVASSAATSLRIAHAGSIILESSVAIASDNRALIAINYSRGISVSGERQTDSSEAEADNENRFEVHDRYSLMSDSLMFYLCLRLQIFLVNSAKLRDLILTST
jgi:hypothetical protein